MDWMSPTQILLLIVALPLLLAGLTAWLVEFSLHATQKK